MSCLYDDILTAVLDMPVIDTHEHLPPDEKRRDRTRDVLGEYLTHYLSSDLVSAGLSKQDLEAACDPARPIAERWQLVERYWEWSRFTGYARALDLSVRRIYGISSIRRETIEELNEAFQAARCDEGHFHRVLKEICHIRTAILDAPGEPDDCDAAFFRRVWQPAPYVMAAPRDEMSMIDWLEKRFGLTVKNLDDWLECFDRELERILARGAVGLKNALAYHRTLYYASDVPYTTAKQAFSASVSRWDQGGRRPEGLVFEPPLQDYIMHWVFRRANEKGLRFQIHTGLQEGNGNIIANSDPSHLSAVFLAYPDIHFDLFHIGYPYQGIVSAQAKNFPNVSIDMCWAHIISPAASRQALDDFLDAVPYNKILGFGGDYIFVDGVAGHLQLAKETISRVLADKAAAGVMTVDQALRIAYHLLFANAQRVFALTDVKSTGP